MKIGFVGLGKMGSNMVANLSEKGHKVVVFNRSSEKTRSISKKYKNIEASFSLNEMVSKLPEKKIVWLMVPPGRATDEVVNELSSLMNKGDIIIDGGNNFFKDSIRKSKLLSKKGIHFLDVGVSGGIGGARKGACMMIGGNKNVFKEVKALFNDMCVKNGYGYMGESGAGHFVKMVHNGIEYGMMSALNEGFEAIKKNDKQFGGIDLKEVAKVYDNGSIIQGRLTHWLFDAFSKPRYLDNISCEVPKGVTEDEMKHLEKMARMPVLKAARLARVHSRNKEVCGQIISALRNEFGGHEVKKRETSKDF